MESTELPFNRAALVREVQGYLRALSFSDSRLPRISVDGIYAAQTTEAVRRFEQLYHLPVTGEVDPATWDRLYLAYRDDAARHRTPREIAVFPAPAFVLRPLESDALVSVLQVMINTVATQHQNVKAVPISGVYDEATVRQIKTIQHLSGLEANGEVDLDTWNALAIVYAHMQSTDFLNKEL